MTDYNPPTLQQAILYFSDPDRCLQYLVKRRWPDGVVICPTCGRNDVTYLATQKKWQCKSAHPKRQFSIKVGTIFEDSPIGLDKWLCAMWMLANCKNGVSSCEVHRALGVTQKTAWFMLHRIRTAMQENGSSKLGGGSGEIEADETFVGGKSKNMHKRKRTGLGRGSVGKAIVVGLLERGGNIRAKVIESTRRHALK